MWDQMKKKLKDMFNSETSEQPMQVDYTYNHKENNDPYVKTKMAYKYPKQGEFRFPVIPDHRSSEQEQRKRRPAKTYGENYVENKTVDRTPRMKPEKESYQARKNYQTQNNYQSQTKYQSNTNNQAKNEYSSHLHKSQSSRSDRSYTKEASNEEAYKIPFQPTEVPSPIYGYHRRGEKKQIIEDLTAAEEDQRPQAESLSELLARYREDASSHSSPKEIVSSLEAIPVEDNTEEKEQEVSKGNEDNLADDAENELNKDEPINQEILTSQKLEDSPVEDAQSYIAATVEASTEVEKAELDEGSVDEASEIVGETEVEKSEEAETDPEFGQSYDEAGTVEAVEDHTEDVEQEGQTDKQPENMQRIEKEPAEPVTVPEENKTDKQQNQSEPENPAANKVKTNKQAPAKSQDRKKESKKSGSSVPFNVIMTPRDKRNRTENHKSERTVKKAEEAKGANQSVTYHKPPLHLLDDPVEKSSHNDERTREQMELLETTLNHFHVRAKVVNAMRGPSVTRFEVQPEPGVKVSKITNLADDIKLSMAAKAIRIEAPIPGKQAVGIEIPNEKSDIVGLQEIFESESFKESPSPLTVALGLDIGGTPMVTNLQKMPHGLIAGATGSGKSVCINTILVSLLYKAHHEDVKFLLIDPKMVELAPYNELPHLVSPVITDVKAATKALKWAVKEMDDRYEKFVKEGVRDVERFNQKMMKQNRADEKMPYLVVVIDELADLMMVSPQDVEDAICRLAQKARACGIHLLVATQRPSVDVITGLIKANIPTRIAFSVSSQVDSRTIIDTAGAEKLLGKGDMLFVENGSGQSVRIQGAFVSDDEIERITGFVKKSAPPNYLFEQEELMMQTAQEAGEQDELFEEAVSFVIEHNGASASMLQRRFKVGYNRAARLIDHMEEYGIISEQKGSKPRDILLTREQVEELFHSQESSEVY
ncbi:DNA translocase FtsK [Thalassobacillus sp. B23F22_16]|uniref:DNA translocase FtsK n=1 Tax=Thalassobacillus sp. B23F22_16 TaxID=3459513 RepID=UPI00373F95F3